MTKKVLTDLNVTNGITSGGYLSAENIDKIYVTDSIYYLDFSLSTTNKSLLGGPTVGITLGVGTYEYELYVALQQIYAPTGGMIGTHNFVSSGVSGSPTVSITQNIMLVTNTSTNGFTVSTTPGITRQTTAGTVVSPTITSGNRYSIYLINGIIRITGTGTAKVYPALSSNATGDTTFAVHSGSYFKINKLSSSGTTTSVGTWS